MPWSRCRFCLPRSFCSCVVSVCIFFHRYCSLCYPDQLLLLFIIFSLLSFTFDISDAVHRFEWGRHNRVCFLCFRMRILFVFVDWDLLQWIITDTALSVSREAVFSERLLWRITRRFLMPFFEERIRIGMVVSAVRKPWRFSRVPICRKWLLLRFFPLLLGSRRHLRFNLFQCITGYLDLKLEVRLFTSSWNAQPIIVGEFPFWYRFSSLL